MSRCATSLAALFWVLAGGGLSAGERAGKQEKPDVANSPGRTLFVATWSALDKRSPNGDGLGPMHNATSCGACHHQAGAGGGGDATHNVDLLSIVPLKLPADPKPHSIANLMPSDGPTRASAKSQFIANVVAIHAGFEIGRGSRSLKPNIVLHRQSTEPGYDDFRQRLLGLNTAQPDMPWRKTGPVQVLEPADGIVLNLSQRNTPALWGAGLIDAIPDGTIQEIANAQKKDNKAIAGRPPIADSGGVGRFGWRGQTARLRRFVVSACANELGLQTSHSFQAMDPLSPEYRLTGEDMSDSDMNELVSFIAGLPRPMEMKPPMRLDEEPIRQGEWVFDRIGCADCHPRTLGQINGLFSDLLLHDMGSALEDPVEPNPSDQHGHGGYSGGGSVFVGDRPKHDPSLPRQWRTPPLWGVSDSAPYLHDGRAATLDEAILEHGGQGAASARQFRNLPKVDRARLMAFLDTLKAPPQPRATPRPQQVSF